MSKRTKLFVILAAVAMMVLLLAGCGDKEKAYVGKWNLVSMEMAGQTLSADDLKGFMGSDEEVYIDFKSGGKADASMFGEKAKLKWSIDKKDDKKIVIDDGTDKMNGTLLKGNELKLESKELGYSMTFKKK